MRTAPLEIRNYPIVFRQMLRFRTLDVCTRSSPRKIGIRESKTVLMDTKFITCLIEEPFIEFRCAPDDEDSFGLRVYPKCNLKRWRKFSLQENAADMRR
jgi:hypothetical protein